MSNSVSDSMGFYEYRNVEAFNIAEGQRRRVLTLRVAANANSRVHIHMNINLQTTDDDTNDVTFCTATYYVDSEEQDLQPEETYIDGKHVLHLLYIMPIQANSIRIFSLFLSASSGTIRIEREGLWAYASGAGLVGDEEWAGFFDLFETSEELNIPDTVTVKTSSESITAATQIPTGATLSDSVPASQNIPEILYIDVLTDTVRIINHGAAEQRMLEDGTTNRVTEDGDARMTEEEAN
jgi:hypothetical protein